MATNAHVVGDSETVTVVLYDGRQVRGDVVGRNRFVDLAVVRIDGSGPLTVLDFADSEQVQAGEDVVALGFPAGGAAGTVTVTRGIVSAFPVYRGDEVEYVQTDTAINPGNSGGPLINPLGQVVGVNTLRPDETEAGRPIQNIGYAISSNYLMTWLPDLMNGLIADSTLFEIPAGENHQVGFDVDAGTEINYQWYADLDLDFGISDPTGRFIETHSRVESWEGTHVATSSGHYSLVFDNDFSLFASKTVALNYVIVPPP